MHINMLKLYHAHQEINDQVYVKVNYIPLKFFMYQFVRRRRRRP